MYELMKDNHKSVKKLAKELALKDYKPVMILKLSKDTTATMGTKIKGLSTEISKETGYVVLVFPNEPETTAEIISIYGAERVDIDTLKEYIYGKDNNKLFETPYTKIREIINKRNEEK